MSGQETSKQKDDSGTNPNPGWIARRVDAFKRCREKRRTEKQKEGPVDRAARSTACATWTIAVLTLVTVVVAGSTYLILKGQLTEMRVARKGSDKSTADQLALMKAQSDSMAGQLSQMKAASEQTERAIVATNRLADAAKQAFLEGNRPIVVIINPHIAANGPDITITFQLKNTGGQTAFVDSAQFLMGPVLEFKSRPELPALTACPAIWGIRALPSGDSFDIQCKRTISGDAAALYKSNNWIMTKASWRYHSQTGLQWMGTDAFDCAAATSYCGPDSLISATDGPIKKSDSGESP